MVADVARPCHAREIKQEATVKAKIAHEEIPPDRGLRNNGGILTLNHPQTLYSNPTATVILPGRANRSKSHQLGETTVHAGKERIGIFCKVITADHIRSSFARLLTTNLL